MCVVFDGYDDPLSTKTHEHARRKGLSSADVNISDLSIRVTVKKKAFLGNPHNKMELIRILRDRFALSGITTEQSVGDADVLVVEKALSLASTECITVVADDTDIFVLLMYHWNSTLNEIYFATKKKVKKNSVPVQYSIKHLVNNHPHTTHLLFAHAWGGCDTTSAVHNQGKLISNFHPPIFEFRGGALTLVKGLSRVP